MHTSSAKQELAILLPTTMSHYFRDEPETLPEPQPQKGGLLASFGALLRWVAELPKRRAVLDELGSLSDHELADIGLTRADLPRVFDPEFAADRDAQRKTAHV